MEISEGDIRLDLPNPSYDTQPHPLNPVGPNSDHRQFSPNNIHMLPREMVMRVNKMITKEKML